jgi:hypothetical protein
MTKPTSDEQLNAFDDEARDYSVVTMTDDEWGALRERLALAEAVMEAVGDSVNANSRKEALAWQRTIDDALAAYRAAKEKA